jgi:hypothetical protein
LSILEVETLEMLTGIKVGCWWEKTWLLDHAAPTQKSLLALTMGAHSATHNSNLEKRKAEEAKEAKEAKEAEEAEEARAREARRKYEEVRLSRGCLRCTQSCDPCGGKGGFSGKCTTCDGNGGSVGPPVPEIGYGSWQVCGICNGNGITYDKCFRCNGRCKLWKIQFEVCKACGAQKDRIGTC